MTYHIKIVATPNSHKAASKKGQFITLTAADPLAAVRRIVGQGVEVGLKPEVFADLSGTRHTCPTWRATGHGWTLLVHQAIV